MATHPSHRGQGYISKLSAAVYVDVLAKGYDFSIGFSNESGIKVDTFSKGYGYKIVGEFRTYRKVILLPKKNAILLQKTSVFTFKSSAAPFLKVEKSETYFKWRYSDRPNGKYTTFEVLKEQHRIAYVVLHLSERTCVILDIIAMSIDTSNYHEIIAAVENYCLSKGIRLLSLTVLDNTFWKRVFTQNYFLPSVYSSSTYYLTVKIHKTMPIKNKLLSPDAWLLMGGDIL